MTVANTRIPYASTFVQTEYEGEVPGGLNPNGYARDGGQLGGPGLPAPQSFIRGEKQWIPNAQNIEDWGIQQMTVANTRIPYASTLVQTGDFTDEYEKDVDMNILYKKQGDEPPEKVLYMKDVPDSKAFLQTKDDDPSKMEGMMMEDPGIPLNLRLLHIVTKEGDELIKTK